MNAGVVTRDQEELTQEEKELLEFTKEHTGYMGQFDFGKITECLTKIGMCPIFVEGKFYVEPWTGKAGDPLPE